MEIVLQLFINGLNLGLTYVLVALGLTIIFSIMGIVNFAHGEIYMLGAFAIFIFVTSLHANFFFSLLITILTIGAIGLAIEKFFFRRFHGQHLNGLVLSLGLSILIQNIALLIWGGDDRSFASPFRGENFNLFGAFISVERVVSMGISVLILILVYFFINRTKTGQAMQAVAQDAEAAALQGIKINYISAVSFSTGCALAGLAGALLAPVFYVSPYVGTMPVLKAFIITVLGGLGSISGALVGGILLGFIDSTCWFFLGTMGDMVGFIILILVIILKPTGLLGYE
jgi:branched-chain amino acid transport system permease protein